MKSIWILIPVLVSLTACDQLKPDRHTERVEGPKIEFVQSAETAERQLIKSDALGLLEQREFELLDTLAAHYRQTKEAYSDGIWKLAHIYNGLEPKDDEPDAVWETRIQLLKDWIDERPTSITPRVALARILKSYAWKARGSGYANTVSETQWELFRTRLTEALKQLQEAGTLEDRCPVYWSSFQMVALGLGAQRNQYDALFEQAILEFPDYDYYYASRAYYLLPRWHGNEGEFLSDLTRRCDLIGGDRGNIVFARAFWSLNGSGGTRDIDQIFKTDKDAWCRVDDGLELIIKAYPNSPAPISIRACFATTAGARQIAVESFKQMNGTVDLSHWRHEEDFNISYNWTFKK